MTISEAYEKGFKDCLSIFISDDHVDDEMEERYVRERYDHPKVDDGPGEDSVYVPGQGYFSY
jgi:hypothetical protein